MALTAAEFRRLREGLDPHGGPSPSFGALGSIRSRRRHRLRRTLLVTSALLLAIALAALPIVRAGRHPRVWIMVNGHRVGLTGRPTVAQALTAAGVRLHGAPLYSVHHHLLDPEGVPPVITVDGTPAVMLTALHSDASIEARPAAAQTEPVVRRVVDGLEVGPGLPDVERTVWHAGLPGGAPEELVGARSGELVSSSDTAGVVPATPDVSRVVELTFDDGPNPEWTPQVLNILQQEGIHATFSLIGYAVLRHPELARQEVALGETICDHTAHHNGHLDKSPHDVVAMEIDLGADIIRGAIGRDAKCYRPPANAISPDVIATAHARHMRVLSYSVDPSDYLQPPAPVMLQRILARVKPGSVIVLHDGGGNRSQTVAMLKPLIDNLKAQGYRFSAMLDEPATATG